MATNGSKVKDASVARPTARKLLAWYDVHRRVMPWRVLPGQAIDPYKIWLSEVMLQQTTVATVGPYFQKFIKKWPTLASLAAASLDDVFEQWAGLGYYRRARFLHACAVQLVTKQGGVFPTDEQELRTLPGFGPYTAAAVAAIAFGKSANVVDGNVERVVARIFAIKLPLPHSKKLLVEAAATLVPKTRGGDYAQALMDLGAVLCTPRAPRCSLCPWQRQCRANADGIQEELPVKTKSKTKPTRRAIAFVLSDSRGNILVERRALKGLLGGMIGVPTSPWQEGAMPELQEVIAYAPCKADWGLASRHVVHVFTHFRLEIRVACAVTHRKSNGKWIERSALGRLAIPTLMKKIIHQGTEKE